MSNISQASSPSETPHPGWRLWVKVARPNSLTATATPLFVGTALAAYQQGGLKGTPIINLPLSFLAAFLAGLFLQIGANYFNEYFDYAYGLDSHESLGASTVIFRNEMSARQVFLGGIGSFLISTVLGIYLIAQVGIAIIWFGLAAIAIAYFYSAKPFKLAARGLGDIMVIIAMGFLMTWGAYYVQIPHWSWTVLWVSLPIGLLVDAILNMNNLRDYADDLKVNKKTLPVRFGLQFGKNYHVALVAGSYLIITVLVIFQVLPALTLLVWLTFPWAYQHLKMILSVNERTLLARGMPQIAMLHLRFGVLLAVSLLLATARFR